MFMSISETAAKSSSSTETVLLFSDNHDIVSMRLYDIGVVRQVCVAVLDLHMPCIAGHRFQS